MFKAAKSGKKVVGKENMKGPHITAGQMAKGGKVGTSSSKKGMGKTCA